MSTNLQKCFPNTSLTIRLSRLLIRTDPRHLIETLVGTPRVRDRSPWDRTVSTYHDSRGTPRVRLRTRALHGSCQVHRYLTSLRGTPRVRPKSRRHNTCPKTDQNCAGLMRAERHVTRRDVVSSQTEGNSVSVVEAVHRVDKFSHKIVQVHQ